MEGILDTIGNILSLIEDAINDEDWDLVNETKRELDVLYEEIDKQSYKFGDFD